MKKINILLSCALFIVVTLLITVLMNKNAEAGKEKYMTCERVGSFGIEISRCTNDEVICYVTGAGSTQSSYCFKK
jgi:hypothetical protein